jgi:spermidine/putrescine transport system substrate-binding protein
MWGTTGFMYNKKYLTADDLQSWGALYDPRYIGKILIKDAFRDVYSCLICYARYDDIQSGRTTRDELVGTISTENIMLVENMLRRAKPNIFGWEVDFGKETMTKGKAWANMTWSGDAAWAIEEAREVGVELDYLVPQEGSNVWFDGWVIPIYSKNPVAASYFINFMCMSENALRNMNEIGYVSVIGTEEVLEGMTDDSFPPVDASYMFGDAGRAAHLNYVYYPDKSVIDRCALMHDCGEKTEAMVEMWSRVKGDSLNVQMIVIICTVIGTILFFYFSRKYRLYRRKVHRRRRLALLSKTQ